MEKRKATMLSRFAGLIVVMMVSVSCQAFFSTSLAPWAARTSYVMPTDMTAEETTAMLQTALSQNNAELAAALLPQLLEAAGAAAGTAAYDALIGEVYSATLLSSGIGTSISDLLPTVLGALSGTADPSQSTDMITTALASFQESLSSAGALSAEELSALALYAADPPADADPTSMIMTAAAVFLISAGPDLDLSAEGLAAMTPEQITSLESSDGAVVALALAMQAQAISAESGVAPLFEIPVGVF